ncbi:hypothetical protein IAI18_22730 [Acetobacteraceae bacterium H6797]|nr:hypothetical protein [Acetobacteraceae bacterium H6797]
MLAAHADWSTDPRKRWVSLARRDAPGRWEVAAPVPVGEPARLMEALLAPGLPVAMGLDLPLGLPRAYAETRDEADFPAFLRGLAARPGFFQVNETLETIAADRPFYPARGVKGMTRASHAEALGLGGPEGLSRWCDRATAERPAGAPVFWTLGANQSGKAAIAAWRDWLSPALAGGAPLRLWPFEGPLHALLAPGVAVLAEVYPAESMRHAGIRLSGSKRDQGARRKAGEAIRAALAERRMAAETALEAAIEDGFGRDAAGEDRFDSLMGLLCLVGVLEGLRPDFVPEDAMIRRWEGWVLGQTALPQR